MDYGQVDVSKESPKNGLKENRQNRPMILERIIRNSICIKTRKGSE